MILMYNVVGDLECKTNNIDSKLCDMKNNFIEITSEHTNLILLEVFMCIFLSISMLISLHFLR